MFSHNFPKRTFTIIVSREYAFEFLFCSLAVFSPSLTLNFLFSFSLTVGVPLWAFVLAYWVEFDCLKYFFYLNNSNGFYICPAPVFSHSLSFTLSCFFSLFCVFLCPIFRSALSLCIPSTQLVSSSSSPSLFLFPHHRAFCSLLWTPSLSSRPLLDEQIISPFPSRLYNYSGVSLAGPVSGPPGEGTCQVCDRINPYQPPLLSLCSWRGVF